MSVVVRPSVKAMARYIAIAAVVLMMAACKSSSAVVRDVTTHRIERRIDTLLTIEGGEARLQANLSVIDGRLVMQGVETTGEGVSLKAHIEQVDGCYSLVVDATVEERELAVQLHEESTYIDEHIDEEKMQDSRAIPVWIVGVVVLVVLILIYIVKRWMKL